MVLRLVQGIALSALLLAQPVAAQPLPAAPGQEPDLRGLLLGLAALAAVGFAIHEREEDEDREEGREARGLPRRCLAAWPTRQGEVRLYDPDCLEARFEAAASLPLGCAVTVRSRGRFVSGFDPACLREEGFRARS